MTSRSSQLRKANPVFVAASRRNARAANQARWKDGPGPITHGSSNTMSERCAAENGGQACRVCLDANAARMRAYTARRRGATLST